MSATLSASAGLLLGFIRKTETGRSDASAYEVIYGHNQNRLPKKLTSMTVAEIIAAGPGWTKAYKSSAAGAYQFMRATLQDLVRTEGLSGNERFTPELQDRLGYALLKRRGFEGFMSGSIGRDKFAENLAKEWASFPVLVNTKGGSRQVERGQSFYAGDGLNKALVKPEAIEELLRTIKGVAPHSAQPTQPTASPKRKTLADWLLGLFVKKAATHAISTMEKNGMNSNLLHNILNVLIALLAGVTAFLVATGCTTLPTGGLECSSSWIDPVWTTGIVAALGALKTIINIARDGFSGLFKNQPPVK